MSSQVVVVTGGGRGIGRSVCERFASDGACVVAVARTSVELEETKKLIDAAGGQGLVHVANVCEPDEVSMLFEATLKQFGRVDVVVNCAGVAPLAGIEELEPLVFEMLYEVNMRAIYQTSRAVWPIMKRQGSGVMVNISSASSTEPFPGFTAYGASKAWVNAWTKGLAQEGREQGIKVFAVAPGAVETNMLRGAFPDFPTDQALDPADVSSVVHTLAQPSSQFITGQTVFIKK